MLLALAASRCDAAAALGRAGASADSVRRAVEDASPVAALNPLERMMRAKPGLPPPMSPEAERALAAACRAAPGSAAVTAEVLLAAMVRDSAGGARRVLDGLGVTQQARGFDASVVCFGCAFVTDVLRGCFATQRVEDELAGARADKEKRDREASKKARMLRYQPSKASTER
jgi:hypothetical protein